jgi:antitoxin component of RelBE/YafQ-DinJ toxin-antitoxin module
MKEKPKEQTVSVRVHVSVRQKAKQLAAKRGITLAQAIAELIKK